MDPNIIDRLMYLLKFMDSYIEESVYNVLEDSDQDPQFSAVTTTNLIKNYAIVMKYFGVDTFYTDVKSYFEHNLFSEEEYNRFEKSRIKELEYYIGEVY